MRDEKGRFVKGLTPWNKDKKGLVPWNKGLTKSTNSRLDYKRPTAFKKGHPAPITAFKPGPEENHPRWKGNSVSYSGLHKWTIKHLGKPIKCKFCQVNTSTKKIQWANKSHNYYRDLNDWLSLCVSCHKKYDLEWKEQFNVQ